MHLNLADGATISSVAASGAKSLVFGLVASKKSINHFGYK